MSRSRLLAKLGLPVLAGAIALLAGELLLRARGYVYTPLRIKVVNQYSEWRYYHSFEDHHFVYDHHLLWRPRKGVPPFNSQGYRGSEIPRPRKPGSTLIFAIGDSNTLGFHGEMDANWPQYLEAILREKVRGVQVVNAGVSGYSSFQGLRRFQEALSFQPDMVLISFGANDPMRVTVPDAEFAARRIRTLSLDQLLMSMRAGQLLLAVVDRLAPGDRKQPVPRVSLREYRSNLAGIITTARANNIQVVLLTRPFRGESPDKLWWKNFAPEYNAATMEVGREHGVPSIDIYSFFRGKEEAFVDESHCAEDGYRAMAREIAGRIAPLLERKQVAGRW